MLCRLPESLPQKAFLYASMSVHARWLAVGMLGVRTRSGAGGAGGAGADLHTAVLSERADLGTYRRKESEDKLLISRQAG
jgi:hypothetical protein